MAENTADSGSSSGASKSSKAKTETPERVHLAVTGMPNMHSFTTSEGLVIDRDGVEVDQADVEAIAAQAARFGVQLTQTAVAKDEEGKK